MNRPIVHIRTGSSAARRFLPMLGSLALLLQTAVPGLHAQEPAKPDLPVIEPRLTRIIGSDTLRISEPVLSPDGRWVAFSQFTGEVGSLWIVSADGGVPRRLIDAPNVVEPTWFPAGDRIAYYSRASAAIMAAPFDPQSGQVSGRPQRVTLEPMAGWFRLSPDGEWIAYRAWAQEPGPLRMVIKIIPANGGTARTLEASARMLFLMDWSADGRFVYYQARTEDSPQTNRVFRVAVAGGAPEEVLSPPTGPSAPRVPYRILASETPGAEPPLEVRAFEGAPVARIVLPDKSETGHAGRTFTSDGRHVLAVVSGSVALTRLLPVAGGARHQLGEARADEVPLGWSPDGSQILFATALDGRQVIMSAPSDGGAAREVGPLPDRGPGERSHWANPIIFSADGRYLSYSRPTPGSSDRTFVIRPVAGGVERVVTRALFLHSAGDLTGPGGTPNLSGSDFLYVEHKGDSAELRATPPEGPSRLIRALGAGEVGRPEQPLGVFGNRVAFVAASGGSPADLTGSPPARILVADGPDGPAKEVAAVPGVWAFDDVVWSPDGRWIAGIAYVATSPNDYGIKILVVGVTPEGEVSVPARLIDTPIIYAAWALQWLPDGSAVTLTGQSPPNGRFDVWFVPVRNGGRPVALTRDDPDGISYNVLSPDGRFIAYRATVGRGTSLWMADLGDALNRLR